MQDMDRRRRATASALLVHWRLSEDREGDQQIFRCHHSLAEQR
jgi:hypothetical protein